MINKFDPLLAWSLSKFGWGFIKGEILIPILGNTVGGEIAKALVTYEDVKSVATHEQSWFGQHPHYDPTKLSFWSLNSAFDMAVIPWEDDLTFPVVSAATEATKCLVEFPASELPNAPKLPYLGYLFVLPGHPMLLGAWYPEICDDCTIVTLKEVA